MAGLEGDYVPPGGILSRQDHSTILLFTSVVMYLLSAFGIGANVLNIKTFFAMGLKDAVTVSLLGLAISDLYVSVVDLLFAVSMFLRGLELDKGQLFGYDPLVFTLFFANIGVVTYAVTILITVFIAVTRCMCVARPLQFKNVFTPKVSWIVMAVFAVYGLAICIPHLANFRVEETWSPVLNSTRHVMGYTANREAVKDLVFPVNLFIIPFSSQVIIVVCILVMVYKLAEASNFRKSAMSQDPTTTSENAASGGKLDLSGKELQAIQQIVLVSSIFIICSIPSTIIAVFGMTEPDFDASWSANKYVRVYHVSHYIRRCVDQLNSSVNIFIYLKYNKKFKSYLKLC